MCLEGSENSKEAGVAGVKQMKVDTGEGGRFGGSRKGL